MRRIGGLRIFVWTRGGRTVPLPHGIGALQFRYVRSVGEVRTVHESLPGRPAPGHPGLRGPTQLQQLKRARVCAWT
jgi:hypothetical protein